MKKILFVFLCVLLCSCSSSRRTVVHEEIEKETVSVEVIKTDVREEESKTDVSSWLREESENTKVHIVYYDTSAPIDEATGKRPVIAEADIVKEKTVNEQRSDSLSACRTFDVQVADSSTVESKERVELKIDDKKNNRVGPSPLLIFLLGIVFTFIFLATIKRYR